MGEWIDIVWRGHNNVRLIVVMTLLYSLASSIWSDTALAAFLLEKTGSNAAVGSVEAAGGLAQLVTALPVGYLADKFGKARLCKVGTSLSLIGPIVIAFAIFGSTWTQRSFLIFLIGMILEGLINGIVWGPLQVRVCASSPSIHSHSYTYTHICIDAFVRAASNCVCLSRRVSSSSAGTFRGFREDWGTKHRVRLDSGRVFDGEHRGAVVYDCFLSEHSR